MSTIGNPGGSLPDWLDDVARLEGLDPAPGPKAGPDLPDWLEDLFLWYGWEVPAEGAQPSGPPAPPIPVEEGKGAAAEERRTTEVAPVLPTVLAPTPTSPGEISPEPPPLAIALPAAPPLPETGFDPDTGRILDRVQFEKWKRGLAEIPTGEAPASLPLLELFRKGRVAIENWLDDPGQRALVLQGDLEEVRAAPGLATLLERVADKGPPVLREKLLHHLAFLVENRRKYYTARPD
jgi:hypothetical protein